MQDDRLMRIVAMIQQTPEWVFLTRLLEEFWAENPKPSDDLDDVRDVIEDFEKERAAYTQRARRQPQPTVAKYTERDVAQLAIDLHSECMRRGGKQLPYREYRQAAIRRLEARSGTSTVQRYTEPAGLATRHTATMQQAAAIIAKTEQLLGNAPSAEKYEQRLAAEAIRVHGEIARREHRQADYAECERIARGRVA